MSLDYLSVRVTRVIEETADSRSLAFELPEELVERFRYRPGQFLTLRVPHQGGWLPRCYSLSSTPLLDEPLRVTIKRVRDGRASNWLCDNVQAGDSLQVRVPAGVFVPTPTCCCSVAVAALPHCCRSCVRHCWQAPGEFC